MRKSKFTEEQIIGLPIEAVGIARMLVLPRYVRLLH